MASLSPVTAIIKVLCSRTTFAPHVLEECVKFHFFFSKNVVQKTHSPRYDNNNNNDIIYLLIIISLHRILSYIHPKIYARVCVTVIRARNRLNRLDKWCAAPPPPPPRPHRCGVLSVSLPPGRAAPTAATSAING